LEPMVKSVSSILYYLLVGIPVIGYVIRFLRIDAGYSAYLFSVDLDNLTGAVGLIFNVVGILYCGALHNFSGGIHHNGIILSGNIDQFVLVVLSHLKFSHII